MASGKPLARKIDPDIFLAELMKGKSARQVLREYGRSSMNLVYGWRKRNAEFKRAYDKVMADRKALREGGQADKPKQNFTDWKEHFLHHFNESDDRINAADRAGCLLSEVFEVMDQNSPKYDEDFTRRFREVELKQAVKIEDDMRRKALVDSKDEMQKFLLPTLPIIGDKYKKGKLSEAPQQNFLQITFTHAGMEGAERALLDVLTPEGSITVEDARKQLEGVVDG